MGYQENEELYLTLSRKELQGLCRKHGLPSNRSKVDMAKELVVYFTNRKASLDGRLNRRIGCSSKPSRRPHRPIELRHEAETDLKLKEIETACKMAGHVSGTDKVVSFTSVKNKGTEGLDSSMSDLVEVGTLPGSSTLNVKALQQPDCICSGENDKDEKSKFSELKVSCQNLMNPSTIKCSMKDLPLAYSESILCSESGLVSCNEIDTRGPASFEFYVRSEEGINLYVDMKSNPSDWINSLKDEVCIHQRTQQDKPWTISNEVKCALTDQHLETVPGSTGETRDVALDGTLRSSSTTTRCTPATELPVCLNGRAHIVSSSFMTLSAQNCSTSGGLFNHVGMGASLQDTTKSSIIVDNSSSSIHGCSSNKVLSDQGICLGRDATKIPQSSKADAVPIQKIKSDCLADSFNNVSQTNSLSFSEENQESLKPSDCENIQKSIATCQISLGNQQSDWCLRKTEIQNGKVPTVSQFAQKLIINSHANVVQPDEGHSGAHLYGEDTSSSLTNPVARKTASTLNEESGARPLLKDDSSGCSQLHKLMETCKRSYTSTEPEDFETKRRLVDTENHNVLILNSKNTKTLSGDSTHEPAILRRRSGRLIAKVSVESHMVSRGLPCRGRK